MCQRSFISPQETQILITCNHMLRDRVEFIVHAHCHLPKLPNVASTRSYGQCKAKCPLDRKPVWDCEALVRRKQADPVGRSHTLMYAHAHTRAGTCIYTWVQRCIRVSISIHTHQAWIKHRAMPWHTHSDGRTYHILPVTHMEPSLSG